MHVIIREVQLSDLNALIYLMQAHAEYEKTTIDTRGLRENLARVLQLKPRRLFIFIASCDDQLIGYGSLTREFSTWRGRDYGHMDCLYVTAAARGQNIGAKLFNRIAMQASELSVSELEWQTPQWNVRADRFYKSVGASVSPKQRYYYPLLKRKAV